MKLLLLLLLLVGCGSETGFVVYPIHGVDGKDGESIVGPAGQDGKDGYSIVSDSSYDSTLCSSVGGNTVIFAQDLNRNGILDSEDSLQNQFVVCDGLKGDSGDVGASGANGLGCTVSKTGKVATVTCDGSSVVINDGTNGTDGAQGPAGLPGLSGTIVEIVELCPNSNVAFKEVALKIAPNTLIAFFQQVSTVVVSGSSAQYTVLKDLKGRLTVLTNGNYVTTDGSGCKFSINNGVITHL